MTVDDVHNELHFVQYEPTLRGIQAIWKSIQQKQSEARKDPSKVKAYKGFLTRCITKLKDDKMSDEQQLSAAKEFWAWYDQQVERYKIAELQSRRFPPYWEAWSEKHLPAQWAEVMMAFNAVIEDTSKRTLENLKRAYVEMFQAYASFHAESS
jgi:hypothetical protein